MRFITFKTLKMRFIPSKTGIEFKTYFHLETVTISIKMDAGSW